MKTHDQILENVVQLHKDATFRMHADGKEGIATPVSIVRLRSELYRMGLLLASSNPEVIKQMDADAQEALQSHKQHLKDQIKPKTKAPELQEGEIEVEVELEEDTKEAKPARPARSNRTTNRRRK